MPALSPRLAALRAEQERRQKHAEEARAAIAAVTGMLRAKQASHPKQRMALRSTARQVAILATRRAGKTSGGNAEDLACALEQPRWRGTYCNATRAEAMGLAWETDTQDGWIDLLIRHGEPHPSLDGVYVIAGITAKVNKSELTVTFSNGSKLEIFAADDPKALDKLRGRAKHRVRVDEAQKFPDLRKFCGPVASGVLKDYQGQLVLQGTPGDDCAGYFYDVTKPLDHGDRVVGWDVHEFGVCDNPFFGATFEERYERAVRPEIEAKGLTIDDPTVQREWFGRWVREGTRYVYPVSLAPPGTLEFAPVRMSSSWSRLIDHVRDMTPDLAAILARDGWYDHAAAVDDLPRKPNGRPRQWLFGIGADFGHDPDPVAVAVTAFALDAPDTWEMFSWKRTRLVPDDWRCLVELLWRQITEGLVAIVGDPGGLAGANMHAWRDRLGIPIEAADKAGKRAWQEMVAGDIRTGRKHYRRDSALLDEHRHLVWMPTVAGRPAKEHADRRLVDGRVPGNHCFVAGTMIETSTGRVPIEAVRDGDMAWTREGLRRVLVSTPTRIAPTFTLTLESGATLTGTGDHPIMTADGWRQLESLTPDCTVLTWASTEQAKSSCTWASSTGVTRSHIEEIFACTSCRSGGEGFTGQCGSSQTVPFQEAFTFITSTETRSITTSETSHSLKRRSICESTWPAQSASWRPPGQSPSRALPPSSGIDPRLAASGIGAWQSLPLVVDPASLTSTSAWFAVDGSRHPRGGERCAARAATPRGAAVVASTTSMLHARSAEPFAGEASTHRPSTAGVRVRHVQPTGLVEQTYELAIDDVHEFIANGVVVANCSDADLYLTRYITSHAYRTPPPAEDKLRKAERIAEEHAERASLHDDDDEAPMVFD